MFFDKEFIGAKFKEYRKRAGLSQEKIAEKTGLAEKHYGKLERGICMPSLETFFNLIGVLNIPLSEFGISYLNFDNEKRVELIREIYLMNTSEIEAYIGIARILKKLKLEY